jgi:hypothetical protein
LQLRFANVQILERRDHGRIGGNLELEQEGETLIVTPVTDLSELNYPQIEAGTNELLQRLITMAPRP